MAAATPQQLLQLLKRGNFLPIYFLQGEPYYYIDQVVSFLSHQVLPAAQQQLNLHVVEGGSCSLVDLLSKARSYPMLGARRIIIIKDAQELSALQQGTPTLLLDYIQAPSTHTILAFVYKGKKLAAQKKLTLALKKGGYLFTSTKIYGNKVPAWINTHVASLGYSITPKAVLLLHAAVGDALQQLAGEVEKLTINLPEGSRINEAHVHEYAGIHRLFNAIALQEALAAKDGLKAVHIAQQLGQNSKASPLPAIIALLTSFFTRCILLHHLPAFTPRADLAQKLGVHAFFLSTYTRGKRNYPLPHLTYAIAALHEADQQVKGIKSPSLPPTHILNLLVAKILRGSQQH
jgi:DNA polymerase-3 subunit delta